MRLKTFCWVLIFFLTGFLAIPAAALEIVTVYGTVSKLDQTRIEGAIVTISFGPGMGSYLDTTGISGTYSVIYKGGFIPLDWQGIAIAPWGLSDTVPFQLSSEDSVEINFLIEEKPIGITAAYISTNLISEFSFFPNPIRKSITIILDEKGNADKEKIITAGIYNLQGKRILFHSWVRSADSKNYFRWQVSENVGRSPAPGIYFLRVRGKDWQSASRINIAP